MAMGLWGLGGTGPHHAPGGESPSRTGVEHGCGRGRGGVGKWEGKGPPAGKGRGPFAIPFLCVVGAGARDWVKHRSFQRAALRREDGRE